MKIFVLALAVLLLIALPVSAQAVCPMTVPIVTEFYASNYFDGVNPGVWVGHWVVARGPNTWTNPNVTINELLSVRPGVVTHIPVAGLWDKLLTYTDHAGCNVVVLISHIDPVTGAQVFNPDTVIDPIWCALATQPGCAGRSGETAGWRQVGPDDAGRFAGDSTSSPVGNIPTGSSTAEVGFCSFVEC